MRLLGNPLAHLVWVEHLFLLDDLWCHLTKSVPFGLESNSTFLGGGVHAKDNLLILISVSERIKNFLRVIEMTIVSEPSWIGDLIVEES
jgi:hypothetical protein